MGFGSGVLFPFPFLFCTGAVLFLLTTSSMGFFFTGNHKLADIMVGGAVWDQLVLGRGMRQRKKRKFGLVFLAIFASFFLPLYPPSFAAFSSLPFGLSGA